MKALIDTSIFVAQEQGRAEFSLPSENAISVITLAELHLGVLMAGSSSVRAQRMRTLTQIEQTYDPIPIDDDVARNFADIVAQLRSQGRRPKVMDMWIAATAITYDLAICTQDSDFQDVPGLKLMVV